MVARGSVGHGDRCRSCRVGWRACRTSRIRPRFCRTRHLAILDLSAAEHRRSRRPRDQQQLEWSRSLSGGQSRVDRHRGVRVESWWRSPPVAPRQGLAGGLWLVRLGQGPSEQVIRFDEWRISCAISAVQAIAWLMSIVERGSPAKELAIEPPIVRLQSTFGTWDPSGPEMF